MLLGAAAIRAASTSGLITQKKPSLMALCKSYIVKKLFFKNQISCKNCLFSV